MSLRPHASAFSCNNKIQTFMCGGDNNYCSKSIYKTDTLCSSKKKKKTRTCRENGLNFSAVFVFSSASYWGEDTRKSQACRINICVGAIHLRYHLRFFLYTDLNFASAQSVSAQLYAAADLQPPITR